MADGDAHALLKLDMLTVGAPNGGGAAGPQRQAAYPPGAPVVLLGVDGTSKSHLLGM